MNNKSFKVILVAMSIIIAMSCFTGCKEEKSANFDLADKSELAPEKIGDYGNLKLPLDDKFTEISILVASDQSNLNNTPVINELRRRTGLNVKIVAVPATTIEEKSKIMLASQESMTDIFHSSLSTDERNDLGIQGAFVKIDEHLDKLPNLKKIFYDEPEKYGTVNAIKNITARDGHLYLFPIYDTNRDVNSGTMYRKDIFDKHNLKADWNNPEEFYQVLKKLKELYPSSTPLSVKSKLQFFTRLGESWGLGTVSDNNTFSTFYDEADGKWKYYATDIRFKEILDFVKKLYDESLLDQEFLTITDAAWASKMTQKDKVFVTNDWIGRMSMYKDQTKETVPEYDLRYGPAFGPTGKVLELYKSAAGSAITNNDKTELALKLSDYLISESGAQLMTMGVEGVTYKMGESGMAEYICLDEGETASISTLEKHGLFVNCLYRRFDRRSVYYQFTEQEKEAQEYPELSGKGYEPLDPVLSFTAEEMELKSNILPELSTAAEEFVTKYILTEETGDKAWNAWLSQAEKLGESKVLKVYNDAQSRYNAL